MKRCPQCGKQYASEANFCPVDAGRLEDVPDDAPAESDDHVLGGRFTVGDPIGGGLTGQVFKATDKESGHPCIVKWVDPAVFSSPLQMQRTERELKQLERQEAAGIARILGHGKRDKRLWIASEYVAGTPLHTLIENVGPLPLERATKIVHDVGVALAEAAKLGVIHRDVAPKNVLVGDGDEVHVINFGVAVPATPAVRGLPEFVAPEQVDGKPVDQRSNIYSLGAMLYTLVTGSPPFVGDAEAVHNAHLHTPPPHATDSVELDDSRGGKLDKLLDRALAKQSSKRFMTLRQLLAELEKLAGIEPASTQRMSSSTAVPVAAAEQGQGKGGKGKSKGKRKATNDAAQTLMGVAAFERPQSQSGGESGAVASPVTNGSSDAETSGALAPPITNPPPIASEPGAMAALSPLVVSGVTGTNESNATSDTSEAQSHQEDDAAATNVLAASGPASQPAQEPISEVPEQPALDLDQVAQTKRGYEQPTDSQQAPQAQPEAGAHQLAQPAEQASALAQAQETASTPQDQQDPQDQQYGQTAPQESLDEGRMTASGKRRKRKKKKKTGNSKFRETMWFKKGELDEAAAEAAAANASGSLVSAKADELPTDVRYKDDGTLSAEDRDRLSLRTGHTQMMSAMDEKSLGESGQVPVVTDEELAREMTGGNKRLLVAGGIVVALILLVVIISIAT